MLTGSNLETLEKHTAQALKAYVSWQEGKSPSSSFRVSSAPHSLSVLWCEGRRWKHLDIDAIYIQVALLGSPCGDREGRGSSSMNIMLWFRQTGF